MLNVFVILTNKGGRGDDEVKKQVQKLFLCTIKIAMFSQVLSLCPLEQDMER